MSSITKNAPSAPAGGDARIYRKNEKAIKKRAGAAVGKREKKICKKVWKSAKSAENCKKNGLLLLFEDKYVL